MKRLKGEIGVEFSGDHNVTVANISIQLVENGRILYARHVNQSAKRHPQDRDSPLAGGLLALGRALVVAGHRLTRNGNGIVKHFDDVKAMRARPRPSRPEPSVATAVSPPITTTITATLTRHPS